MIDLGRLLEGESERFLQEPGARDRFYQRGERRRRNRRIGAGVVGVAISIATIAALLVGSRVVGVPAEPSPSPSNGRIAFARILRTGGSPTFATYTANPDGTDVRRLPGGASYQPMPRWSPDGRRIAITEPTSPRPGCSADVICTTLIVDVETGTVRGIPWSMPGVWDVNCFLWTPDGTRLACGAIDDNGTGLSGIYTVRASDGGDPRRVAACGECVPGGFSPDGDRFVFSRRDADGNLGLIVVGIDGSGSHPITPPGMLRNSLDGGSWSPTGDQIVFQARGAAGQLPTLWVVNADGSGLREIPTSACGGSESDPGSAACRLPRWSPDGRRIVFSRRSPGSRAQSGIYIVNADGTDPVRVTTLSPDDNQPDWGTHPVSTSRPRNIGSDRGEQTR